MDQTTFLHNSEVLLLMWDRAMLIVILCKSLLPSEMVSSASTSQGFIYSSQLFYCVHPNWILTMRKADTGRKTQSWCKPETHSSPWTDSRFTWWQTTRLVWLIILEAKCWKNSLSEHTSGWQAVITGFPCWGEEAVFMQESNMLIFPYLIQYFLPFFLKNTKVHSKI